MAQEKSYENAEGNLVFTSHYLRARGTCCKSNCIHCPYGYTLKKLGMQFLDWSSDLEPMAQSFMNDSGKTDFDLAPYSVENRKFIKIKDQICGFFVKNHIVVKAVFLGRHFQDQDLSREMIESYYFI
jgi:biotin synthase-like enzyme